MNLKEIFSKGKSVFQTHKSELLLCLFVLGVGIWARFFQMTDHFVHTDDLGIAEQLFRGQASNNIFFIPQYLTNAPLQYLFTYFLISPDMGYRELLFWGRLPSCVAGCLALGAMILFYRRYDRAAFGKFFFATALVACSWENIVFAKQMHSYAIGVLAAVMVFGLFVAQLRKETLDLKRAALIAGVLALVSHMQYQALLFVPAFYTALLIFYLFHAEDKTRCLRNLFLSGLFYGALIFPMWHFFLRPQYGAFAENTKWALGTSGEYGLSPALLGDLGANGIKILWFYLKNLYVIFESKTGFFPETVLWFKPMAAGLFSLFLLGVFNFIVSPEKKTRFLGLFFFLVLLMWWIMVLVKQLPYGPSRHTLILLPFFAVTASEGIEGFSWILRRWTRKELSVEGQRRLGLGGGLLIILLFLAHYGVFLEERKNTFTDEDICRPLEAFDAEEIFYDFRGFHLEYMKCFRKFHEGMKQKKIDEVRTFAFITRYPFPSVLSRCEAYQTAYNMGAAQYAQANPGSEAPLIRQPCTDFQVVYGRKKESDVVETFSKAIPLNILTNRFFFYILSVDPEKIAMASKIKEELSKEEG